MSLSELGIDCGTSRIRISQNGKVVLDEPSVVATQQGDGKVLCVGEEARRMLGRTPQRIVVIHPMESGVVAQIGAAEAMIRQMIARVSGGTMLRPSLMFSVPPTPTQLEEKAYRDLGAAAGSRRIGLIPSPMAAALGAGVDVTRAKGVLILDIGAGTSDIAVISLSGIVVQSSVKAGGQLIDRYIAAYIRSRHGLLIGESTAEQLKFALGAIGVPAAEESMICKGKDAGTRMPAAIEVTSAELRPVILRAAEMIASHTLLLLERTPPELLSDIAQGEVLLLGGGSLLAGLDAYLRDRLHLPFVVAPNPAHCTAIGCCAGFSHRDEMELRLKKWKIR